MFWLIIRAYLKLIYFEFYLARDDFASLYKTVRVCPIRPQSESIDRVCAAVDFACIWYWKQVLCLQRSATTACLAKQCGLSAKLVIGTQQIPFNAHAWVEVNEAVVNDKPYMREMYAVMDTC